MISWVRRYTKWLHTRWPAGAVEKLPQVNADGSTRVPGLYVVGDLTGIPLLKFAADGGARVVRRIAAASRARPAPTSDSASAPLDLVIIGAGVSGMAAAVEAKKQGLRFEILEASEPFSTIVNFPRAKPIFTYPTEMVPAGDLQFTAEVKEPLIDELRAQTLGQGIEPRLARAESVKRSGDLLEVVLAGQPSLRARQVVVAIGRSGNFRKLGVAGETLDKVYNRLHDPRDFHGQDVLVVGGGDSALETAIALAQGGARVALSYRKPEFSRPKPDNIARIDMLKADPRADVGVESPSSERVSTAMGRFLGEPSATGSITLYLGSKLGRITEDDVELTDAAGVVRRLPNQAVFAMIGREAPLDFFRRSGVGITGETRVWGWVGIIVFLLAMVALYDWKNEGPLSKQFPSWGADESFPKNVPVTLSAWSEGLEAQIADRSSWLGVTAISMKSRSFYYTLVYTLCIGVFGWLRIRRRKTPYVTIQTTCLFLVQLLPLFLLPEIVLPWMGYHGWFESGWGQKVADQLFPLYGGHVDSPLLAPDWGHPRAYWRAYGFILAWPLFVYNFFTATPMTGWLIVGSVQTFVIIPLLVYFWGKGAYCGWICSCGGLAETLGDTQRHKMLHGGRWNRLNMVGQGLLLVAFLLFGVRIAGWVWPESWANQYFDLLFEGKVADGTLPNLLSWKWFVDVFLGGVIGVGLYFKYSGRVWCRFACPLAALMHIYARFSRFAIVADKKKCISCNVCTSVCHQGIDIMNFANKGAPMRDPECVRCSACVQSCPTGVLQFAQVDGKTNAVIRVDRLAASPVLLRESKPGSAR
ncbi:MAG: NAD(P)-binding domain-containing protein [Planctomycetota bacterium]